MNEKFIHSPYLPVDENVADYNNAFGHLSPYRFSDFKTESLSWKKSCYLHAGLNPAFPYLLRGKDVLRLLSDTCVNDFRSFRKGNTRHAVMCNENGNIMSDGIILSLGNDEYISYFLSPYINYFVDSGKYDVQGFDLTGKVFLFQLGGMSSLNILEKATKSSLRHLDFFKHMQATIYSNDYSHKKYDVRILRMGVAGTLAYEVHGNIEDAENVYNALLSAGEEFGIERLGMEVYGMNHTENGFVQSYIHFTCAFYEDKKFMEYLGDSYNPVLNNVAGSAGENIPQRYLNPVEAGWSNRIHLDHDFIGREAIEEILQNPKRQVVTLVWNEEDIEDVYASQFREGDEYQYMDFPANPIWTANNTAVHTDIVQKNGKQIGLSSGRIYTVYYKAMISLGILNISDAVTGNEVEIIWGEPDSKQKIIRATVARFPFLDLPKNREIDVKNIL
ncbi:aminomethyl transferase family protein [Chryseobacterium wangxinyae]|uniref:aminomethyl transferase family protein n=1 Tax=Chryseobacterium sp. CY350 TaxID=2997336 RepID=UPI002271D270|nr:aminomethyl transferase family protein [Chryseobacterium sp. CY350]MCY0977127.1 aminomethyl transferase family protein [Chryseobacterium sp. CY350]WBZ95852.1 aminomethyl transferase family protein [Chryseobacterium sp. CY350]